MPSNIKPVEPDITEPKAPPPDVTAIVVKINEFLSRPWEENERRCGRCFVLPDRISPEEVKEIRNVFSKWETKFSTERTGKNLSFKKPGYTAANAGKFGR